jgi:hypothetical protein
MSARCVLKYSSTPIPRVSNTNTGHSVEVETDGSKQSIAIAPKSAGRGSSVNGGELLLEVEVTGTFGNPGEPAGEVSYRAQVQADSPQDTIDDLIRATDAVTEIQSTLRAGCAVRLEQA